MRENPLALYILAWILYLSIIYSNFPYYYNLSIGWMMSLEEDISTKSTLFISGIYLFVYIYLINRFAKESTGDKDDDSTLHIRYSSIGIVMVVLCTVTHFILI